MQTYTVPVFIGVQAKSKQEAIELVLNFMEHALDVGNDAETYPYSSVGNESEVVEQA